MAKKKPATTEEYTEEEQPVEETTAEGGRRFRVMHMGISGPISPFLQGQIVDEADLRYNEDVDIDRLLNLGAIVESDGEDEVLEMVHEENAAYVDSRGIAVDQPGLDRPNVAAMIRGREVKTLSAKQRLEMFGKTGRRGKVGGVETELSDRSVEAVQEQQRVQRNLRDNTTVPAEVAETLADEDNQSNREARDTAMAEYAEPVDEQPDPDEMAPQDPALAPDMVPEPRGGRGVRRGR